MGYLVHFKTKKYSFLYTSINFFLQIQYLSTVSKMHGHGSQWILYKISIRHPLQLRISKSCEPFRSYQLNSTANPAHLPQNRPNFEVIGRDWQCCLAGSSHRAPRILIFSIAMGADYSFYVKTIETHARALFKVIIFSIGSVP